MSVSVGVGVSRLSVCCLISRKMNERETNERARVDKSIISLQLARVVALIARLKQIASEQQESHSLSKSNSWLGKR